MNELITNSIHHTMHSSDNGSGRMPFSKKNQQKKKDDESAVASSSAITELSIFKEYVDYADVGLYNSRGIITSHPIDLKEEAIEHSEFVNFITENSEIIVNFTSSEVADETPYYWHSDPFKIPLHIGIDDQTGTYKVDAPVFDTLVDSDVSENEEALLANDYIEQDESFIEMEDSQSTIQQDEYEIVSGAQLKATLGRNYSGGGGAFS